MFIVFCFGYSHFMFFGEILGFCPFFFFKKIQHFVKIFKLIREMSMFWNLIFGQSSYNKLKIKKKKKFQEPYSGVLRIL